MQNRQDRIYQETNTTVAANAQVLNFVMGEGQAIHDGLALIPAKLYPENPGLEPLLPNHDTVGAVSFLAKMTSWLSPLTFVIGWANTWEAIKRYSREENKNLEKTLNLGMNIVTTAASTTIMALILAGVVYAAPYLIAGMLGAGMAYGFFNLVKHSYRAYRAHKDADKEKRNAHLWALPKQLLSTAVNSLGFVLNFSLAFHVGPQLSAAYDKLTTGLKTWDFAAVGEAMALTKSAGATFSGLRSLFYGLSAVVTLGAVPTLTAKALHYNAETLNALKHPVQTLKNAGNAIKAGAENLWNVIKKKPYVIPFVVIPVALEMVSLSVQAVTRVASLALAPLQLVGLGVTKTFSAVKSWFTGKPVAASLPTMAEPLLPSANDSTFQVQAALQAKHAQLKVMIADEVTHLETQKPTKKILSKLYCMQRFDKKLGTDVASYSNDQSVGEIETDAKVISPYLKQSFWREEGRVEKISRVLQHFDTSFQEEAVRSKLTAS